MILLCGLELLPIYENYNHVEYGNNWLDVDSSERY